MAVENDYNLLVTQLGFLAENIEKLHGEVQRRLLEEKRGALDANATHWVNLLVQRLPIIVSGPATQLQEGAWQVLRSPPGEAVFDAQPPEPPDAGP